MTPDQIATGILVVLIVAALIGLVKAMGGF